MFSKSSLASSFEFFIFHLICFIAQIGCEGSENLRQYDERPTIRDIQRNLCRRIYQEAKLLAKNGKVSRLDQDLFAEQSTYQCF